MTDYTITTNFGAKDSLPSGNAGKVIKGEEFTTEFTNIQTAVNTKADTAGDTFTGAVNFSADVAVNTNTLFVDVSENRVGIGTTSPASTLHIYSQTEAKLTIQGDSDNDAGEEASLLEFKSDGNAVTHTIGIKQGSANDLIIDSGNGTISNVATEVAFRTKPSGTTTTQERMRIDSSGKVGIGTSTPQYITEIAKTQAGGIGPTLYLHNTADSVAVGHSAEIRFNLRDTEATTRNAAIQAVAESTYGTSPALTFLTSLGDSGSATERMRIDSSGNVGIGTDSPSVKLHIDNGATSNLITQVFGGGSIYSGVGVDGTGAILTAGSSGSANASMIFRTASNGTEEERMRIDSSGNVLIGTTDTSLYNNNASDANANGTMIAPSGEIQVARYQNAGLRVNRMGNDGGVITIHNRGVTVGSISTTSTATTYITSSDERLKENITDSADAGSKVDAIQIRQFDWKADGSHQDYGVIAQELIEVAPEAVAEGDAEEDMMGVDYSKLVPMLIKEVQSLRSRVAELENV